MTLIMSLAPDFGGLWVFRGTFALSEPRRSVALHQNSNVVEHMKYLASAFTIHIILVQLSILSG